jgi:hypothetical protein
LRRLLKSPLVLLVFAIGCAIFSNSLAAPQVAFAQQPTPTPAPAETPKPQKTDKGQRVFTAEEVVESAIFTYGSRPLLAQVRRNGVERGRICKPTCEEGKVEEATYERRFVRGENMEQDKIRLDQKMPTLEYSLIYGEGHIWGIINGASFTPRQDAANTFLTQHRRSIDNLLRYKENGSTLSLVGKDKQKGLDLYVVDVTDKNKQLTRYYLSLKSLSVLWLEYEETPPGGTKPMKYVRKFMDYRVAQGTKVPYRSVLLENGTQVQETRILNVTYSIKLDDALFKNPEA